MINRVVLIGRVVASPEVKYTQSGIAVASFTIAVERNFKNTAGEKQTDFINVVAWIKLAELCYQYLEKGQMAGVEGSLQMKKWEKDGEKRTSYEVLTDNVQFLSRAGKSENNPPTGSIGQEPSNTTVSEDDREGLPF